MAMNTSEKPSLKCVDSKKPQMLAPSPMRGKDVLISSPATKSQASVQISPEKEKTDALKTLQKYAQCVEWFARIYDGEPPEGINLTMDISESEILRALDKVDKGDVLVLDVLKEIHRKLTGLCDEHWMVDDRHPYKRKTPDMVISKFPMNPKVQNDVYNALDKCRNHPSTILRDFRKELDDFADHPEVLEGILKRNANELPNVIREANSRDPEIRAILGRILSLAEASGLDEAYWIIRSAKETLEDNSF
jgi:hypothetical protein